MNENQKLAEKIADAHYAAACSTDSSIAAYDSPVYMTTRRALLIIIRKVYNLNDSRARDVYRIWTENGDRIADAIEIEAQEQANRRASPEPAELSRTRIAREIYGNIGAWVLVERTDTGKYYIVSTNDDETLTVESDALGTWDSSRCILSCSGVCLNRTEAIIRLDELEI